MSEGAVLCVGRVYCDLVFSGMEEAPQPGQEVYAKGLTLHTGGGAAITAHTLASLGRQVELCASIPASPFSHTVESDLQHAVSLRHCSRQSDDEPQVTVVLTGHEDRSFITNRANHALPENYQQCLSSCASEGQVAHLHIAELATLVDHPDLIALAREANWTISLDCAWDSEAMHSDIALALINQVDVFLPNEAEFSELVSAGLSVDSTPCVVIKKGESGAQMELRGEVIEVPADNRSPCIDATGAGDAFNAGFIDAWLRNEPALVCLESGVQSGTAATRHFGGIKRKISTV